MSFKEIIDRKDGWKIRNLKVENVVSFSWSWKKGGGEKALVLAAPAHTRSNTVSSHSLPVLFTLAFTCSLSLALSLSVRSFIPSLSLFVNQQSTTIISLIVLSRKKVCFDKTLSFFFWLKHPLKRGEKKATPTVYHSKCRVKLCSLMA